MDHSIFGDLMNINGDFKKDSLFLQEEVHSNEQIRNSHFLENSVEEGYSSDFYPLANLEVPASSQNEDNGTESMEKSIPAKKNTKRKGKKKLTSKKGRELRFSCTQCDYKTWKKSNFQRHLGTHNKPIFKCTICPYKARDADNLKKHIMCHISKQDATEAKADDKLKKKMINIGKKKSTESKKNVNLNRHIINQSKQHAMRTKNLANPYKHVIYLGKLNESRKVDNLKNHIPFHDKPNVAETKDADHLKPHTIYTSKQDSIETKNVDGAEEKTMFVSKQNFTKTVNVENLKKHLMYLSKQDGLEIREADNLQKSLVQQGKKDVLEAEDTNQAKKHVFCLSNRHALEIIGDKRYATLRDEVTIEPRWTNSAVANKTEIKRESKEESELYCPPVEVYLNEHSSNNSYAPDSSVEEGYDSDFYPLAVHLDIPAPSQNLNTNQSQLSIIPQISSISQKKLPLKISKEPRYMCPYCSYSTWKTSNFQRHLCTHTNERPHKCPLCEYRGKHHEDLKKHLLCHKRGDTTIVLTSNGRAQERLPETIPERLSEIVPENSENNEETDSSSDDFKNYACTMCDFTSTRSSVLYKHQRVVHNNSRPYTCELCPYRSKQRNSMKKHMMAHTDERPFECEICHYRCRQKVDMKRHKLLHSGEKPFLCPYCPFCSNRSQILKKHISRRHNIPSEGAEMALDKTNLYEEFTGGHYLADMF